MIYVNWIIGILALIFVSGLLFNFVSPWVSIGFFGTGVYFIIKHFIKKIGVL